MVLAFCDTRIMAKTQGNAVPAKSRWLDGPRAQVIGPIVAAAIGAGATLLAIYLVTPHSSLGAVGAPPSISIGSPRDGTHIPGRLTVTGRVKNLRPNQVVEVYNETAPGGAGSGIFYPALAPCPVSSAGAWHCTVYVGRPGNYGDEFLIWAAIVTSTQAYEDNGHSTQTTGPTSIGYAGDKAPPHTAGPRAVTKVLVIRCGKQQACP